MELKNAKLMGGIGAILTLGAFIPVIGLFFGIIGLILVLLAIKDISNASDDKAIFKNYLVSFILNLVGYFVAVIAVLVAVSRMAIFGIGTRIFRLGAFNNMPFGGMMNGNGILGNFGGDFLRAFIVFGVVLILAWVISIIGSYFNKLSFEGIAKVTKSEYFKTSGLLIFIGSILLVIFGLGAIIMFVGIILEIVAFFSLPERLEKPILESEPAGSPTLNQ